MWYLHLTAKTKWRHDLILPEQQNCTAKMQGPCILSYPNFSRFEREGCALRACCPVLIWPTVPQKHKDNFPTKLPEVSN
jgi:hypothetical protein